MKQRSLSGRPAGTSPRVIKMFKLMLVVMGLALPYLSHGQAWTELSADELFDVARKEVFAGDRANGREKLEFILTKNPSYHEVKIFLARTYSWDKLYSEGAILLHEVLEADPSNLEALDALIDVEKWSGDDYKALAAARRGQTLAPARHEFVFAEAQILNIHGQQDAALVTLDGLLEKDPTHARGLALRKEIRADRARYSAGIQFNTNFFDRTFDPAQDVSLHVSRRNSWGSSIVRYNYAHRFQSFGGQLEADLYPRLWKGGYAYVNYGFSSSSLFPKNRAGAELFVSLPLSFEVSAGARYMDFGKTSQVVIYTGSVSWYFSDYLVTVRSYVTPDKGTDTSVSASFLLNRYFSDADNYIGLSGGVGFSPDLRTLQSGEGLSENAIYVLKSQRIGLTWQKSFGGRWIGKLSADVARQELAFDTGKYVMITSGLISVEKRF